MIEEHITDTLKRVREEVAVNGVTEAASDMLSHAIRMYRKHRLQQDDSMPAEEPVELSMFLRPQAG